MIGTGVSSEPLWRARSGTELNGGQLDMIVEPKADHLIWLDGAFVPWCEASIHVSDNHYGVAVFEGVRVYSGHTGPAVFRLHDHTARLFRSAQILNIDIPRPYDREQLNQVHRALLPRTGVADAYVRPFVFYGGTFGLSPRARNLTVHVAIMALEWNDDDAYHGADAKARGLTLRTATFT